MRYTEHIQPNTALAHRKPESCPWAHRARRKRAHVREQTTLPQSRVQEGACMLALQRKTYCRITVNGCTCMYLLHKLAKCVSPALQQLCNSRVPTGAELYSASAATTSLITESRKLSPAGPVLGGASMRSLAKGEYRGQGQKRFAYMPCRMGHVWHPRRGGMRDGEAEHERALDLARYPRTLVRSRPFRPPRPPRPPRLLSTASTLSCASGSAQRASAICLVPM